MSEEQERDEPELEEGQACRIIPEGDPGIEIAPDGTLILHNPTPELLEVALTLNPDDEQLQAELEQVRKRFETRASDESATQPDSEGE